MLRRLAPAPLLVALLCGTLLWAPPAASQPAPSAPLPSPATAAADQADTLYREGLELAKAKEWPKAYQKFLHAYQLKRSFDIATNLGAVEFNLGKYTDAAEHLRYGLSMFPANGKADQKKAAEDIFVRAKGQVGILRLKVTPVDADVRVNDRFVGTTDNREEVFVEAGDVRIEAGLKGHESVSKTVKVDKGGAADAEVALKLLAPSGPSASATASVTAAPTATVTDPGPDKALVIGGAAAAGAVLIVGGSLLGVGEQTRSQLQGEAPKKPDGTAACSNTEPATNANATCNDLRARAAAGNALGQAGITMLVAGGLLGIGTAVYGLWPRSKKAPTGTLVPVVSANGAGFVWTGSF